MRIKTLYLKKFGKFTDKTIRLDDGINVVYGFNESGKSTAAFFIFAMLFGINDKDKSGLYGRFCPWEGGSEFCGSMDFEHNGVNYRLSRSFYSQNKSLKLENRDTGREVIPAERVLGELFPGLGKKEYLNSYFCTGGTAKPSAELVSELNKHMTETVDKKSTVVDTDYALRVLDERRRGFSGIGASERLKELEELIDREEKTERRLDEMAALEISKQSETEELKKELEGCMKASLFEEKEQEYYRHKERYRIYKKDIEHSRGLSEQLEKTIKAREELESNLPKLERCKEELGAVRIFKKKNKEAQARTRQEIESAGRLLLTESKNNLYTQTVFVVFTAVLAIAGIVMKLEEVTPFYSVLLFAGALASAVMFAALTIKWQIKKQKDKEALQKLRGDLKDYVNEYELYFRAHSSEEELVARYEECLKEDGRIPGIIEKENELSGQLEKLNLDLAAEAGELLEFFRQFGMVEDLKEDELLLQEETLRAARESRLKKAEEIKNRISELNESMIKMHMQVEAGEDNEVNLLKHREEREALLEKQKENNKKVKAIELAMKMIETLASEDHESFGRIINQKASRYAAAFTGNQYTSFITDEKLNCKVDYYNKYIPVEELSNGAEAQMNLALRLTVGDVLLKDYELPLVFDDAFVYYDDERLAGTLMEIGKRTEQIIIFTCQNREETILNQLNLEYRQTTL